MAYILIEGIDTNATIQEMQITVRIHAKSEYYNTQKYHQKIKEIQAEFENVVQNYFQSIESEVLSNHEYNLQKNNGQ